MRRKDAGFGLLELMVTLSIAALVITIGLPSFSSALARLRVTTTLHLLTADMAMARGSAVVQGKQVVVCPRSGTAGCSQESDWGQGWLVFIDPDGNRRPDSDSDVLRASDPPAHQRLSIRSTRPFLRYQADGRSAHSNLTVHVCEADALAGQVVVNNHGRVRSARPETPTACPSRP
ncbi:GspH/FimT family pseudopilin [Luteimonas sp. SDU101]|uniref:GspH/FimT family pseudopilin n=1 Tax=Luteimonas sp. SDU101 TaxID=3422593 RepID=UPI003EBC20DC